MFKWRILVIAGLRLLPTLQNAGYTYVGSRIYFRKVLSDVENSATDEFDSSSDTEDDLFRLIRDFCQ